MLRVLLPVIVGAVLGVYIELPIFFSLTATLICGVMALLSQKSIYMVFALLFATLFSSGLGSSVAEPPFDQRLNFSLSVKSDAREREGYSSCRAELEGWYDGEWHPASGVVVIYSDSTFTPNAGERLLVSSRLKRFSSKYPDYAKRMQRRGGVGVININQRAVLESGPSSNRGVVEKLHGAGVRRVQSLGLDSCSQTLVEAMAVGERANISDSLRRAYSLSGTAHLLAVSGLHVGVVFMLINLLLYLLPLLRWGNIIKSAVAIAVVWLYAMVVGLTPSVVRATIMFSILQLALISSSEYRSLNSLFAAAAIMLLIDPSYIFDVGFRLSFIAVIAILSFIPLILSFARSRWVKTLLSLFMVSVVATVATSPLISHDFGYISVIGLIINPIVVPLAEVVVALGVGWMILPIPLLGYIVRPVIELLCEVQISIIEWAARSDMAAIELRLGGWITAIIYLLFVLIIVAAWSYEKKKRVTLHTE